MLGYQHRLLPAYLIDLTWGALSQCIPYWLGCMRLILCDETIDYGRQLKIL